MKKIKIINVDKNELIATFATKKKSYGTIQIEVIEKIKDIYKNRAWIQGTLKFGSNNNNCLIGGNLWWVVSGCDGKIQFEIE